MYKLLLYLSTDVAPFPLYVSIRKTTVNMNGFGSVQIELMPLCGVAKVAPPTVVNKMICGHAPHADDDYQFTSIALAMQLITYRLSNIHYLVFVSRYSGQRKAVPRVLN